jgi:hypothetical protein
MGFHGVGKRDLTYLARLLSLFRKFGWHVCVIAHALVSTDMKGMMRYIGRDVGGIYGASAWEDAEGENGIALNLRLAA